MINSLSDLELGQKAKIIGFDACNAACRQKLFACGLIPGAEVSIVRVAPLGDPLQIRLDGDVMLSIRRSEGYNVKVERAS
jgi:ferrous iron transport protein A